MTAALKMLLFVVGLLGVVYGSWMIYRPLGWIIGGVLCIFFALLIDKLQK